jgi:hypothetical protein
MKIRELKGQDIVKAYDCNYLSHDFGYSCANFNVKGDLDPSQGNDMEMFDFYIENEDNISCFVIYDKNNKINGRRMFFKGPSLLNDRYFDVPAKMGEEIGYMYGYYGCHDRDIFNELSYHVFNSFKGRVLHTDRSMYINKVVQEGRNYFILQVEKTDFDIYPPIDFLHVCPEIRALSNFDPGISVMESLEKDFGMNDLEFYQSYRFDINKRGIMNYSNYFTWSSDEENEDEIQSEDDSQIQIQEDEKDEELGI